MRLARDIVKLFISLLPIYLMAYLMLVMANMMVFGFYRSYLMSWKFMPLIAFGVMVFMLVVMWVFDKDETADNEVTKDDWVGFGSMLAVLVLVAMPIVVLMLK